MAAILRCPGRVKLSFMSHYGHMDQNVTSTSPAGKNQHHFSKNKMYYENFYRPKESFEKTDWHSNDLVLMKQCCLVN